jgi:hypothetical protein
MYTLAGFTVNTAEQARTILLMAMLKQDQTLAAQAHWVLKKLGGE